MLRRSRHAFIFFFKIRSTVVVNNEVRGYPSNLLQFSRSGGGIVTDSSSSLFVVSRSDHTHTHTEVQQKFSYSWRDPTINNINNINTGI